MSFFKNLFKKKSKTDDYDSYVVQEKIKSRWNDVDEYPEFMEQRTAIATHAQDYDKTLRLIGVASLSGKERRDVLWTHWAIADIEAEEDKKEKKNKKGDGDFLDTITKMQSLGFIQTKTDFSLKDIITMTQEAKREERANIQEMMAMMGQKSEDESKYRFYGDLSKTVKEGIMEGAHILKGDDGEPDEQQKRLPPAPEEFDPNAKPEIPAFVAVLLKYQASGIPPTSFLDMLKIMYPGQYADLQQNSEEKLVEFLSRFTEMTSALRSWIQNLYEILNPEAQEEKDESKS